MYIDKTVRIGYNAYLPTQGADVGMQVGLLALEPGQTYAIDESEREVAALLLAGRCVFRWADRAETADRPDCFRHDPWCLHVPRGTAVEIDALEACELYVQRAENPGAFAPRLYRPEDTMVQHAGANGELLGCMRREIKTLFDYESAPYSNMVLGEVLNFPGKWSSYPPHHHPQPEVYLHRFDHPQGFGASFANGEIYQSRHNGLTVIESGFHSQTAAPGYAMMYVWGIRHLPGDPWRKTRIDDPEHAWLWKGDANEHIFTLGG
jgi:5-deoxy-glucuronate isomerase